MENFTEILRSHAALYTLMRPADVVKLIYQSVFGGGHLIKDGNTVLPRLKSEYAVVSHEGKREIESLGDCSRIYIDRTIPEQELKLIAGLFVASSTHFPAGFGTADTNAKERFHERFKIALKLAGEGVFSFGEREFDKYLRVYFAQNCPAVSHSDVYREAYKPAYRVIDTRYVRLLGCVSEIHRLLAERKVSEDGSVSPVVAVIDGRAASGKTTAAELIAELFGVIGYSSEIVHTDDFFLPIGLRTPERLAEAGGNLHRERFSDEVLAHIRDRDGFCYRRFDCSIGDYVPEPRRIKSSRLIICEGAYALHPSFGKYYDLAVFSDITRPEQERRILARNGAVMLERFKSAWIPMEERYFQAYSTADGCGFVV